MDGRGKLGGHVFTKTRSGATMRTKVTPVNPQSPAQAAARSRLGSQSQAWRGLTEEQRIGWNDLAARSAKTNIFGDQYFPTGKNLFTGLNSNLLLVNQTVLSAPPELREMPVVIDAAVSINTVNEEIVSTIGSSGLLDGVSLVMEATAPMSAGRYNFDGSYRVIFDDITAADPGDVYAAYVAKFGTPPMGTKIAFRYYYISQVSGQASPRFSVATFPTDQP